jgi:plasmid stabilization system protein ParE
LTQLYLYITEQSGYPERAIDYIRRLRDFCESLAAFPRRGKQRNDLRLGLWVAGFEKRVAIAYMIRANGDVEIGRVFYGGRDYETLLRESGEE